MLRSILRLTTIVGIATALNAQKHITAREVIERIQKNVGVPWREQTVDTFKAGDPDTPVTGIATTMMATFDVLRRAAASSRNLIITHEPTFYGHLDRTDDLESENDAVYAAKKAFIAEHHLWSGGSTTTGTRIGPMASRRAWSARCTGKNSRIPRTAGCS